MNKNFFRISAALVVVAGVSWWSWRETPPELAEIVKEVVAEKKKAKSVKELSSKPEAMDHHCYVDFNGYGLVEERLVVSPTHDE